MFFLPAASHVEKEGTFTQTQRLLQWREKAVDPPGDCPLRAVVLLPPRAAACGRSWPARRCRATGRCSTWPGTTRRTARTPSRAPRRCCARSTGTRWPPAARCRAFAEAARRRLHRGRLLDLLRGVRRRGQPGGPAQVPARAGLGGRRVGLGLAGEPAHPLQPGLRRPAGPAVERAQDVRLVGRRQGRVDRLRRAGLRADQAADVPAARRRRPGRRRSPATTRSSCRATARAGCTRRAGCSTGRCPRTTSRPSRRCATRSTVSRPTRPARSTSSRRTRSTRARRSSTARSSRTCSRSAGSPSTTPPVG